jgi:Ser/Thr protein kinase RdoA (MazF antagonist)
MEGTETFSNLTHDEQVERLERLGRNALKEFGIEEATLTPLVHMENTTFKVESCPGIFNLRISRSGYQSTANVRSEIAWLDALSQAGFHGPRPYQGRLVTAQHPDVPQPRDCALFVWMDGEFVRRWDSEQAARVGGLMARLHEFVENWEVPAGFDRQHHHDWALRPRVESPADKPHPFLSEDDREMLLRVENESQQMLASLPRTPDRYRLIHADLHAGNVLFDNGDVAAIDFDDASYAFVYYDFAAALAYQTESDQYEQVRDGLLAGYRKVRQLPPDTLELLNPFLRHRLAGVADWVLRRIDNPKMREGGGPFVSWLCERISALEGK